MCPLHQGNVFAWLKIIDKGNIKYCFFFFTLQCTCTTAFSFLLVCQPQDTMTGLDLASVSESKILRIQEDVILKNTKNAAI